MSFTSTDGLIYESNHINGVNIFPGNEKNSSEDFQELGDYRKVDREFLIPLVRFNHLYNL